GPARVPARRRRLVTDRQTRERRLRDGLGIGCAAPSRTIADRRPGLPARRRVPPPHAETRRDLVRGLAEPALPALFREWLPLRQGPVHLRGGQRLGRRGAGPNLARPTVRGRGTLAFPRPSHHTYGARCLGNLALQTAIFDLQHEIIGRDE